MIIRVIKSGCFWITWPADSRAIPNPQARVMSLDRGWHFCKQSLAYIIYFHSVQASCILCYAKGQDPMTNGEDIGSFDFHGTFWYRLDFRAHVFQALFSICFSYDCCADFIKPGSHMSATIGDTLSVIFKEKIYKAFYSWLITDNGRCRCRRHTRTRLKE